MDIHRVIVTGVSRGLGKDVLRMILKNDPDYEVVGTVRNKVQQFEANLHKEFPKGNVKIMELDIYKKQSVDKFSQQLLKKNYQFDCLINNAAVGCDYGVTVPSVEVAESTLVTNFIGTVELTNQLLPLLKPNGRIINVSSKLGALSYHDAKIRQEYSNENISLEWIRKQVQGYIESCKKGHIDHYFKSAYGTSKMMLNAWSRFILKKSLKPEQVVISMSPGHCKTDMGKEHALRTCQEGALSIYQHIKGQYSSDIFYHVGSKCNFDQCG